MINDNINHTFACLDIYQWDNINMMFLFTARRVSNVQFLLSKQNEI